MTFLHRRDLNVIVTMCNASALLGASAHLTMAALSRLTVFGLVALHRASRENCLHIAWKSKLARSVLSMFHPRQASRGRYRA